MAGGGGEGGVMVLLQVTGLPNGQLQFESVGTSLAMIVATKTGDF